MSRDEAKTLSSLSEKPAAVAQKVKPVPAGSPRYRVEAASYIGGRFVAAGEEIEYDGRPGQYLTHIGGPKWEAPVAEKADTKVKPV